MPPRSRGTSQALANGCKAAGAAAAPEFGDFPFSPARVSQLSGTAAAHGYGHGRQSRPVPVVILPLCCVKALSGWKKHRGHSNRYVQWSTLPNCNS